MPTLYTQFKKFNGYSQLASYYDFNWVCDRDTHNISKVCSSPSVEGILPLSSLLLKTLLKLIHKMTLKLGPRLRETWLPRNSVQHSSSYYKIKKRREHPFCQQLKGKIEWDLSLYMNSFKRIFKILFS